MDHMIAKIEDIGKLAHFKFELRTGVNTFMGANGVGKSTTQAALVAALGGPKKGVTATDGVNQGRVWVNDELVLKVGKSVTADGHPSFQLASYSAISEVVTGGDLEDPKKADARRVKAILSMCPLPVTEDVCAHLAVGDVELMPIGLLHVLDVAEHVRQQANALALAQEKLEAQHHGEAQAHERALAEIEQEFLWPVVAESTVTQTAEEVRATAEKLRARATQQELLAKQRAEAEARHKRITATAGERPDTAGALLLLDQARMGVESAAAIAEQARKALAAAEARLIEARALEKGHKETLEARHTAAAQWDAQQDALREPITGPTMEEAEAAAKIAQEAEARVEVAELGDRHDGVFRVRRAAEQAAMAASARATVLRSIAQGVSGRLGELLEQAGAPGLAFEGGRLLAKQDGQMVPFQERFSAGQKMRKALEIALRAFKARIIPLDPHYWFDLQPSAKQEVHEIAVELEIFLVTEVPNDEPNITVVHGVQ